MHSYYFKTFYLKRFKNYFNYKKKNNFQCYSCRLLIALMMYAEKIKFIKMFLKNKKSLVRKIIVVFVSIANGTQNIKRQAVCIGKLNEKTISIIHPADGCDDTPLNVENDALG